MGRARVHVVAYDSWPIDDMIALGNPSWRTKSPRELAEFLASGLPHGIYHKDRLTPEFREGIVAPYSDEKARSQSFATQAASTQTTQLCWLKGTATLDVKPCACGVFMTRGRRF